jgi:hypothetical protein
MAGQLINRGKNVWLIRVYTGRDVDTGSARSSIARCTARNRMRKAS